MKVVQFITTALLLFCSAVAFTQATVTGTLNDRSTRQKLSGATVSLTSSTGAVLHTVTDEDGEFRFKDLNEGDYTLEINYVGFTSYVQQLHTGNKKTGLKISLIENAKVLSNIHVFTKINAEEESSSRISEKNANNITNVISAKAMERSPDINAANVLQRMSGITLQKNSGADESYAIVRGLEPRYNNTLINGVKITSPDEKSRFVSLDIVPSDLLQKIEVSKSLLPDMEGDAIGGTVNLIMKDAPDSLTFKATAQIGYSKIFFDRKFDYFSKPDIQSKSLNERFGDKYVAQPGDFTRSNLDFKQKTSLPTTVAGITYGKRFLNNKLGILIADNFQNQYYGSNSSFNIVSPDPQNNFVPHVTDVANRTSSTQQLNNGLAIHADYNFNDKNKIIINNVFLYSYLAQSRLSVDTAIVGGNGGRTVPGTGPIGGNYRSLTNNEYLENFKIEGKHILSKNLLFDWTGVYSSATKKSPDRAEVSTNKKISVDSTGKFVSTPYYFDGITRIWQHNEDKDYDAIGNLTYRGKLTKVSIELKAGGLYRHKDRNNRQDEYDLRPVADSNGIKKPYTDIYSAQWTVYNPHGTFNYDVNNYHAHEDISAGYAEAKISFEKLDISGGLRYEYTSEGFTVNTFNPTAFSKITKTYADLLPGIQLKYKLSHSTNIRASFNKSISRPNYFELVPYTIRGQDYDEVGNPNLQHTVADNYDLRYELFPSGEEQLFVSAFYKKLKNPIENALLSLSGGQLVYTPQNFGNANITGAELVYTKYFGNIGFTFNYTYISSKVKSPKIVADSVSSGNTTVYKNQSRPLQGQSDNVLNFSLLYKNDAKKLFVQLAYEYIGKTLSEVYPNYGYDYYQQPQSFLSLSAEKSLSRHFVLFGKFNNLLNTATTIKINNITVGRDIYKANFNLGIRYSH
jgi:TonB-dependent receptor